MKKGGQEVPIEVLNDIGALHFEKEEFEVRNPFITARFFLNLAIDFNTLGRFSLRSTILRRLWEMEYGLASLMKKKN